MRILFVGYLAFALSVGCKSKEEVQEPSPQLQDVLEVVEQAPVFPREVFGIPLPPELVEVSESSHSARVVTNLSLKEVATFYESRLQDYEFIEVQNRMELRPLREFMPVVRIVQPRKRSLTGIYITVPQSPKPKAEMKTEYVAGELVDFKLPNGEELAPGARWGEPYTPPPGSPLAAPRYKSNHGKPFGTWVPQ